MKMRIATKLMLGAAVGVLAVVSVVSVAAYGIAREGLAKEITSHLQSVAQSRAAHVQTLLEQLKDTIATTATSIILADGLRELASPDADTAAVVHRLNARLAGLLPAEEGFDEVFLLDREGRIVASTAAARIGLDRSTDAYFVGGRDGPFIKDAHLSTATGRQSLAISAPLMDEEQGELLGVIVARLGTAELDEITADPTGLGNTGETYLINKYGFMITPSRFLDDTFLKLKVDTENSQACLEHMEAIRRGLLAEEHEHEAMAFTDYRGVAALGVHAHIPETQWGLLVEIDAAESLAPIARLRSTILLFAVLFGVLSLAVAGAFARRISGPIHELHAGSERIGNGDLDYRVDVKTGDEIQQLAHEFNRMAAALSESYATLEQKVADRTAELQKANEQLQSEITERKRAQEALKESEQRFKTLVEQAADAIFVVDMEGRILDVNAQACQSLGYGRDELLALNIAEVDTEVVSHEHRKRFWEKTKPGETVTFEGTQKRKDGTTFPVEVHLGLLRAEPRRTVIGLARDVTERKRAEDQLQRYAADLEKANEEVRQFAYIVSHDLRAPLVNLKGFSAELRSALEEVCSTVRTVLPQLTEDRRQALTRACQQDVPEALQFIDASVTRMDSFINALLKLSRLGHRELTFEPVNVEEVVRTTLDALAHQIEERRAKVTVGALPEVIADRTSMEQIVGNLLTNAVQYLDPDRPGEIEITGERRDDETAFRVRDNGRGIAERDMPKVLAPFRRAGSQDVPGEGMGLSYVQALVSRHGGRIWCESEPGRGTTFTFTISNHLQKGDHHA